MDLISRQAAIEAALGAIFYDEYWTEQVNNAIDALPSAEPKKGRWIFARCFVWECSECGKNPTRGMGYTQSKKELFRYCTNCGAKMEVL